MRQDSYITRFISIIYLLAFFNSTFAGERLDFLSEKVAKDSVLRAEIDYFPQDIYGDCLLWDLSDCIDIENGRLVYLYKDSLNRFSAEARDGVIRFFENWNDSILLTREESPLTVLDYDSPLLIGKNTMSYLDSTLQSFCGDGLYCGRFSLHEDGTSFAKAEARGTVLLSEKDSLHNVIMIHRVKTYFLSMNSKATIETKLEKKLVIEECLEWYATDMLYPIIEIEARSCFNGIDLISSSRKSYCNLPESYLSMLAESSNVKKNNGQEKSGADGNIIPSEEQSDVQNTISFRVNVVGKNINLNYITYENSYMQILIVNVSGSIVYRTDFSTSAEVEYSRQIDMSHCRSGEYILYLNVNGNVFFEKVML